MADKKHLALLKQGVKDWNLWKEQNPRIRPNLKEADLRDVDLSGVNLSGADLMLANLTRSFFSDANLSHSNLTRAKLVETNLVRADLRQADLTGVVVNGANLRDANLHAAILTNAHLGAASFVATDLSNADLKLADLSYSRFIETNLEGADLTSCRIYGVSAWSLRLTGALQHDLIITRDDEPRITVDNIEVAQFVYLLLNNPKIREVIDTITSKVVLILGRFTAERKPILDALRETLRRHNYSPILFDFEKPANRDLTETISTLAHMARFIVADITDAKSLPQELDRIVPDLPSVPVQPLLQSSAYEYSMFEHFRRYPWVLPVYQYESIRELLASIEEKVITPAEAKVKEQRPM
jgi:hypothetical protein